MTKGEGKTFILDIFKIYVLQKIKLNLWKSIELFFHLKNFIITLWVSQEEKLKNQFKTSTEKNEKNKKLGKCKFFSLDLEIRVDPRSIKSESQIEKRKKKSFRISTEK